MDVALHSLHATLINFLLYTIYVIVDNTYLLM